MGDVLDGRRVGAGHRSPREVRPVRVGVDECELEEGERVVELVVRSREVQHGVGDGHEVEEKPSEVEE